MLPPIKGFIENTLIDWEGKIAAIVFLPRCNWRCPYCHATHLVLGGNELESIPVEAVTDLTDTHKGWIDGVVITGGEPTLHSGLDQLCEEFKKHGLGVKLDTNGSNPAVVKNLAERKLIDYVAIDLKAALGPKYAEIAKAQVDLLALHDTITFLIESEIDHEFRITVCPAFLGEEDVIAAAKCVRGARRFILQQFSPKRCLDKSFESIKPYPREQLTEWADKCLPFVKASYLRGEAQEIMKRLWT
jgi:pyruvate formate lyase activating enzyme